MSGSTGSRPAVLTVPEVLDLGAVDLGFDTARSEAGLDLESSDGADPDAAGLELVGLCLGGAASETAGPDLEVIGPGLEEADCDAASLELVGLRLDSPDLGRTASETAEAADFEVVCLGGCEVTPIVLLCEPVVRDDGRKSMAAILCSKIVANK